MALYQTLEIKRRKTETKPSLISLINILTSFISPKLTKTDISNLSRAKLFYVKDRDKKKDKKDNVTDYPKSILFWKSLV